MEQQPSGTTRHSRRPRRGHATRGASQRKPRCRWCVTAFVALIILGLSSAALAYMLETAGVPPRLIGPYVVKRTSGHNPTIVAAGNLVGGMLLDQDRGASAIGVEQRYRLGAQPETVSAAVASGGPVIMVASAAELGKALNAATPGDVITLVPGHYRFTGQRIDVARPGTAERPITVRAALPGSVTLDFAMVEGFVVSAPYWHFENLVIKGACDNHSDCEHAFHVVGGAHHFVARNNTISDFNAHFKINELNGVFPDDGLIEYDTLTDTAVRNTANPVTPIDLVAASNWVIRKNLISDFFKGDGDRTSYGGFVKGAGSNNLFENNLVFCEYHLRSPGARQVGLSLGGGGTGAAACRDKRCITEQDGSSIVGNLIAACSDDGIYLNRAATSKVIHNTLIDTGGISVRFPQSTADVIGNLVDGKIRARDDAILRQVDNRDTATTRLVLGSHPVRNLFDGGAAGGFLGKMPRREPGLMAAEIPDLCDTQATARSGAPAGSAGAAAPVDATALPVRAGGLPHAYGAFNDFSACLR